jgi:hypothetical protein
MQVRLDIADLIIEHNQKKAKSSLENAKKDGHISSQSKNTRRNVTVLAETCQDLPYLFKTDISFDFRRYALLKAFRGLSKYSLNSGILLNSKVCSPD